MSKTTKEKKEQEPTDPDFEQENDVILYNDVEDKDDDDKDDDDKDILHTVIKDKTRSKGKTVSHSGVVVSEEIINKKELTDMKTTQDQVQSIFEGTELTEDFKTKVTALIEAAIAERVTTLEEEAETALEEKAAGLEEEMLAKLDEYASYVAEQWMEENRLAVETGIKSELTESFLTGLKTLFDEHYIDIPAEKVDVVEELSAEVNTLKESLDEQIKKNIELNETVKEAQKDKVFTEVSEGLSLTDVEKFKTLTEKTTFDDVELYKSKISIIKESYFKKEESVVEEPIKEEVKETAAIVENLWAGKIAKLGKR